MLLTDEKETALNTVMVALQQASDHYAQSVELLENRPAADHFARLLHLRRAAAVRLSELVHDLGFLPAQADPDRLALTELATRVKAALAQDVDAILNQKALQLELGIESGLVSALSLEWPAHARTELNHLLNETRREVEHLQAQSPG